MFLPRLPPRPRKRPRTERPLSGPPQASFAAVLPVMIFCRVFCTKRPSMPSGKVFCRDFRAAASVLRRSPARYDFLPRLPRSAFRNHFHPFCNSSPVSCNSSPNDTHGIKLC